MKTAIRRMMEFWNYYNSIFFFKRNSMVIQFQELEFRNSIFSSGRNIFFFHHYSSDDDGTIIRPKSQNPFVCPDCSSSCWIVCTCVPSGRNKKIQRWTIQRIIKNGGMIIKWWAHSYKLSLSHYSKFEVLEYKKG